jgi:glycosyltransferase involved in cell wall biosynthesis
MRNLGIIRNPYKCFYGSSYDRGLQQLLEMWPDIIKAVPQATLTVRYGWQLFDKFYSNNPSSMMWKARIVEMLGQPGISAHGRLPQPELEKEMRSCGIWSYPTTFGEINCINALKAQAFGLEPVVVNYAALKETVQFGRKVDGDIYDQETKEEYKKQLIDALKNPMSEEKREEMMKWAKEKYAWEKIAKEWGEEFKK